MKWEGALKFSGEGHWGARVTIEPGPKYGGSGKNPTPMEALAMALASCTGMDAVLILEKMRVELEKFEIHVDARRREAEPSYFEAINMTMHMAGRNLTQEKAEKAVGLSLKKYCSVAAMLEDKASITYEVKLE